MVPVAETRLLCGGSSGALGRAGTGPALTNSHAVSRQTPGGGGALRKPGRGGADLLPGPVRFQPFPAQEPCVSAGGRVLLTQTTGPYHRSGTWQAEGREAEGGRGQAAWWPQRITAYCEQMPLGLGLVGMLKGDFSALLKAKCGLA